MNKACIEKKKKQIKEIIIFYEKMFKKVNISEIKF